MPFRLWATELGRNHTKALDLAKTSSSFATSLLLPLNCVEEGQGVYMHWAYSGANPHGFLEQTLLPILGFYFHEKCRKHNCSPGLACKGKGSLFGLDKTVEQLGQAPLGIIDFLQK